MNMDRLTEKITNIETGNVLAYRPKRDVSNIEAFRKLGEYEDAEEQGLLIKLPCKPGTIVCEIFQFLNKGAWEIEYHKLTIEDVPKIGKTVFLTREEAEAALAEMDG